MQTKYEFDKERILNNKVFGGTVPHISANICSFYGAYDYEAKVNSLMHRVKGKDNPKLELRKGLGKMGLINELVELYIEIIPFENLHKSKHGGRGEDKNERKPKGKTSYAASHRQEHIEKCTLMMTPLIHHGQSHIICNN